jgi:hypothetical protein
MKKIKINEFRKKAFLIPLNQYGTIVDYKQFNAEQWKKNIVELLKMVNQSTMINSTQEEITEFSVNQFEEFLKTIKSHLNPNMPCLCLGFPPAHCWFIPFITEAFLPYEKINVLQVKSYSESEQTIEIIKNKGDPILFALNLLNHI